MSTKKIKVYVAGALSGFDYKALCAKYEAFGQLLQERGFDVLLPHQQDKIEEDTAVVVYQKDVAAIKSCDAVAAFIDLPSLGTGIEIATALALGKDVIALAERTAHKARAHVNFAQGAVEASSHGLFRLYDTLEGAADTFIACFVGIENPEAMRHYMMRLEKLLRDVVNDNILASDTPDTLRSPYREALALLGARCGD